VPVHSITLSSWATSRTNLPRCPSTFQRAAGNKVSTAFDLQTPALVWCHRHGDGEALDCALAAQELLERALGAPEAGALLREVGNFDFDAALTRVRSLGARLGPAVSGEWAHYA
jgi:hypothetical protein